MFSVYGQKTSQALELEIIFSRYLNEVKSIDSSLSRVYVEKMRELKRHDILVCLPYWLTDAMSCHHPLNVIRALALGNLYGTSYILVQDRIIDRQSNLLPDVNESRALLVSNHLYYKWIKEYQRVFPAPSRFWLLFEKYLVEYTNSILWEKQEHWGKLHDFAETDLKYLGQKLSPLKISGAGMCLLNNRTEWIPLLSQLIEQYHIGYQLADDVSDWREDLRNRNYTYYLTQIHKTASAPALSEQEIDGILLASTITNEVLEKSTLHYLKAREIAKQLSSQQLCTYLDDVIQRNEKQLTSKDISATKNIGLSESALNIDTALLRNDIHCFENTGRYFVFDVNRHLVFTIDRPSFEVLQLIDSQKNSTLQSISQSTTALSLDDVADIIKEFRRVGIVRTVNQDTESVPKTGKLHGFLVQRKYESIVSIDLQISTGSPNHQLMTIDVGRNAIDLLFHRSGDFKRENTVFLSCAALGTDEADFIQRVIEYSGQLGRRLNRTIRFILSTPLMQTSNDSFSQCIGIDVLSSIILSTDCDDVVAFSKRVDVQHVVSLIRNSKKPVSITLTLDDNSKKLERATKVLRSLGFEMIFLQPSGDQTQLCYSSMPDDRLFRYGDNNHFCFLNSLSITARTARQNLHRFYCNAGKAYLSIMPDGTVLPCPRFSGHPQFSLGNVFTNTGIDQTSYLGRDVRSMESCYNCWARYICGGGCMFHSQLVTGSLDTPDSQWCIKYKEQVEHSVSRYYSLPSEERKKLDEAANLNIQFCDSW